MKKNPKRTATNANVDTNGTDRQSEVQLRAYYLWLADGCKHGNDFNHWIRAEKEVNAGKGESSSLRMKQEDR